MNLYLLNGITTKPSPNHVKLDEQYHNVICLNTRPGSHSLSIAASASPNHLLIVFVHAFCIISKQY